MRHRYLRFAGRASCLLGILSPILGFSFVQIQFRAEAQAKTSPPAPSYPEFPPGPGRETVLTKCSTCHAPLQIIAVGQGRQGWEDTVVKMVGFGLIGTDEEFSDIVDYLTASFPPSGKVNINAAMSSQIVSVFGVTPDEAKTIVDYRTKNGKFSSFEDLRKVQNVDISKLEAKKDSIVY